uniref:L antigen family member 3 n=1 Tax=Oryctolagus cuniculus TaxID=9986 RepID=U3KNA4_RABIT
MQAPDGSADGGTGSSEGRGGQRSLGDPASQVSSGGTEGKGDQSTLNPLSAPGNGARPAGPRGQEAPSGPDDQGSPGVAAAAAEAAVAPPVRRLEAQANSVVDCALTVRSPRTLTVPFRSPLEAEMARRSLDPAARRHQGVILEEFAVKGSDLTVRWTAEDPVPLQISINCFLDRLSLVIRNIRPCFPVCCWRSGC